MSQQKIEKIFVVHYKPLSERRVYLESILRQQNLPYEFRTNYDRHSPEIDDTMYFQFNGDQMTERNKSFSQQGVGLVNMNNANRKPGPRACFLEHINVLKDFVASEMEHILVLEDDVRINDGFFEQLPQYMQQLPIDFDVCYAGLGCNLPAPADKTEMLVVEHQEKRSRCTDCYIISKKAAKIIVDNIFPAFTTIDWEIMYLQYKFNMKIYWVKEPLVVQGSETGAYATSLPMF